MIPTSAPFKVPAWLPRLLAPYMARITSMRMPLSNAKARAELGWRPKHTGKATVKEMIEAYRAEREPAP